MKVALVIGHKEKSQGARNNNGVTEFEFNKRLVAMVHTLLAGTPLDVEVVYRDRGFEKNGYRNLPDNLNSLKPDYIISFHANAFNTKATGTETLYYHSSKKGKKLANKLQNAMTSTFEISDRGIKPKHTEDRGGILLRYTDAPCVIIEPFFIDNNRDFLIAENRLNQLADNLAYTIGELNV